MILGGYDRAEVHHGLIIGERYVVYCVHVTEGQIIG